jgi:beta-phosphoglucomutase-like phosphatase (HAD superfamily)
LKIGLVTSSSNCKAMLAGTGLHDLFAARVDARTAARENLRGKPHPDTFFCAARRLGSEPGETAACEDAPSGLPPAAPRTFGYVVGVDRSDDAAGLLEKGADIVVNDLSLLLPAGLTR